MLEETAGKEIKGASLDFLVASETERVGIEFLNWDGPVYLEKHVDRRYPITHELTSYVVVSFKRVDDREGYQSAAGKIYFRHEVPVFYVFHTPGFDQVKLMYMTSIEEKQVITIHIFGS